MKSVGNAFLAVVFLAGLAVVAAKPGFIAPTFTGASNLIRSAVSPVTGKA